VKFCQLIVTLSVILLQIKSTKLKFEVFKSDFQRKKKDMNTDKLAINWQNFARVRLQLMFAIKIRPYELVNFHCGTIYTFILKDE